MLAGGVQAAPADPTDGLYLIAEVQTVEHACTLHMLLGREFQRADY
jgi:hypothetical protein